MRSTICLAFIKLVGLRLNMKLTKTEVKSKIFIISKLQLVACCSYPLAAHTAGYIDLPKRGVLPAMRMCGRCGFCFWFLIFVLALAAPTRRPRFIYMGETYSHTHTHAHT